VTAPHAPGRAHPLHPDRLLPTDPGVRALARDLYAGVRELPVLSPHGHVPAQLLADDAPFTDPTSLILTPDHYVTRLLHADRVPLEALGVGQGPLDEDRARAAWRLLCTRWSVFRGTAVRYWLDSTLQDVFGTALRPGPDTADLLYDHVAERLARPEYRPRALLDRFRIDVLATTDDPVDDLAAHAALRDDPTVRTRVLPTFRPDRYLEAAAPGWVEAVERLGAAAGTGTGTYRGWVAAMADRRAYFRAHGAVSADHSHEDVGTAPLEPDDAERLYARALAGTVTAAQGAALRRHMLLEMARLSTEDGLTMTLHPGVRRGHHGPTLRRLGPDTGHDIPLPGAFTDELRPLLERYGTHPGLRLVLFTLDESVVSRELAPLAGFYPAVYVGAPWWFLDAPASVRRWRESVTEIAGLSRTSGFIDDTRALCSIPARHDMARRLDAGFLAGLVAEHRLDEDEAADALTDLVTGRPTAVFRL
jgi:glucuronate isomerase